MSDRAGADRDDAKLKLLYRVPTPLPRGRALQVTVGSPAVSFAGNWPGEFALADVSAWAPGRPLTFIDGPFDIVILHRTLDALFELERRRGGVFRVADFLSDITRLLADGGLVIGCVANRYALDRVSTRVRRLFRDGERIPPRGSLSVMECRDILAAAAFHDIRLFSMLPDIAAPNRILSIEPARSRRAALRYANAMRAKVRPAVYSAWRLLALSGVSHQLGPATFFWGRK